MKILIFLKGIAIAAGIWLFSMIASDSLAGFILQKEISLAYPGQDITYSFEGFKVNGKMISGSDPLFVKYQIICLVAALFSITAILIFMLKLHPWRAEFRKLISSDSLRNLPLKPLRISIAIGVALVIINLVFSYLYPQYVPPSITSLYTALGCVIVLFINTITIPIVEEIVFRFQLFGTLEKVVSSKFAFVTTSIIFALCHIGYFLHTGFPERYFIFSAVLAVSFLLGYFRYRFNTILLPIFLHIANNLLDALYR